MSGFADDLHERYRDKLARSLGVEPDAVEISDGFAAYLFALDLMEGDPDEHKAGYSAPNAYLTAIEVFPEIDHERLAGLLGVSLPIEDGRP